MYICMYLHIYVVQGDPMDWPGIGYYDGGLRLSVAKSSSAGVWPAARPEGPKHRRLIDLFGQVEGHCMLATC